MSKNRREVRAIMLKGPRDEVCHQDLDRSDRVRCSCYLRSCSGHMVISWLVGGYWNSALAV